LLLRRTAVRFRGRPKQKLEQELTDNNYDKEKNETNTFGANDFVGFVDARRGVYEAAGCLFGARFIGVQ